MHDPIGENASDLEGRLLEIAGIKHDLLSVADPQEKEHREKTLAAIERNLRKNGIHEARPHDTRARQFMPFAALKGYSDMTQEEEERH